MYEDLKERLGLTLSKVKLDSFVMVKSVRDEVERLIEKELVDEQQVLVNVEDGVVKVIIFTKLNETKAAFALDTLTSYTNKRLSLLTVGKKSYNGIVSVVNELNDTETDKVVSNEPTEQIEIKAKKTGDNNTFIPMSRYNGTATLVNPGKIMSPIHARRLKIITLLKEGVSRKEIVKRLNIHVGTYSSDVSALKYRGIVVNTTESVTRPIYTVDMTRIDTLYETDSKYIGTIDNKLHNVVLTTIRNNKHTLQDIVDNAPFAKTYIRKALAQLVAQGQLIAYICADRKFAYYLPEEVKDVNK